MPASDKAEQQPAQTEPKSGGVDIERLADRVYRLMLNEARLERSRSTGTDH